MPSMTDLPPNAASQEQFLEENEVLVTEQEEKFKDALTPICNFKERIPSELLHYKDKEAS